MDKNYIQRAWLSLRQATKRIHAFYFWKGNFIQPLYRAHTTASRKRALCLSKLALSMITKVSPEKKSNPLNRIASFRRYGWSGHAEEVFGQGHVVEHVGVPDAGKPPSDLVPVCENLNARTCPVTYAALRWTAKKVRTHQSGHLRTFCSTRLKMS